MSADIATYHGGDGDGGGRDPPPLSRVPTSCESGINTIITNKLLNINF